MTNCVNFEPDELVAPPLLLVVGDATQPRRPLQNQGRLPEVVGRDSNRFRDVRLLPEISQLLAHPEKNIIRIISAYSYPYRTYPNLSRRGDCYHQILRRN
jgi:hypothetical protein